MWSMNKYPVFLKGNRFVDLSFSQNSEERSFKWSFHVLSLENQRFYVQRDAAASTVHLSVKRLYCNCNRTMNPNMLPNLSSAHWNWISPSVTRTRRKWGREGRRRKRTNHFLLNWINPGSGQSQHKHIFVKQLFNIQCIKSLLDRAALLSHSKWITVNLHVEWI